jgi:hypothetical protein
MILKMIFKKWCGCGDGDYSVNVRVFIPVHHMYMDVRQSPRSVLANQSGLTLVVQYMLLSTIGIDVLSCSYRKRVCT